MFLESIFSQQELLLFVVYYLDEKAVFFDNMAPVICLMGPTASGKTDLAIEWVTQRSDLEIISVDSTLVYRNLNIGTAKPSQEILATIPHHLIDIRDPNEIYSAGDFHQDALRIIANIHQSGKIPLLVGGTMLYFWILEQGLANLPPANPELRSQIEARAAQEGWAAIHAELQKLDPTAAKKIHPNDSQRLQRALEIYLLTGKPISQLQQQTQRESPLDFRHFILAPNGREELTKRIRKRTQNLFAQGFIEEVQSLHTQGNLHRDLPSMRAVGYQQIWSYLERETPLSGLEEKVFIATCQLAKRQMTWLRRWPNAIYLN